LEGGTPCKKVAKLAGVASAVCRFAESFNYHNVAAASGYTSDHSD